MDNFWKNGKSFFTFALIIAVVGSVWIVTSRAGSSTVSVKPDGISVVDDVTASGDSFYEFGPNEFQGNGFKPASLEDWGFASQNTYTASNRTLYAAPTGSDTNDGTVKSAPVTLDKAVAMAAPGDVVYLLPGTYRQDLYIKGKKGTEAQPIVFTTEPGQARKAIIASTEKNIARIISSEHIVIDSIVFDGLKRTTWGVVYGQSFIGDKDIGAVSNMKFIGNEIKNNNSEATLKVRLADTVLVHNNYLHDGGNPAFGNVSNQGFAEGMYFGCGGCPASENRAANITVTSNKVQDVGGEGIEFKAGVRNIVANDNLDLDTGYNQRYTTGGVPNAGCCYGAGITVTPVQDATFNTNVTIERNRIGRITAHGVVIGGGDATVRNNLVWQTGQKHRFGITAAAREPFGVSNWFGGRFNKVTLTNNHSFSHATPTLKDDLSYGNPNAIRNKALFTDRDIIKHQTQQAAFSAWLKESF